MGLDKLDATGGDVRTRRDDARGDRGIQREDLIRLRFSNKLLLHRVQFVWMWIGNVLRLAEVRKPRMSDTKQGFPFPG